MIRTAVNVPASMVTLLDPSWSDDDDDAFFEPLWLLAAAAVLPVPRQEEPGDDEEEADEANKGSGMASVRIIGIWVVVSVVVGVVRLILLRCCCTEVRTLRCNTSEDSNPLGGNTCKSSRATWQHWAVVVTTASVDDDDDDDNKET
jgi:hypothetical protein